MNKVKELFGIYTKRNDVDWKSTVVEQYCPYIQKKCIKVRKSNSSISIGVCTIDFSIYNSIAICPHRLLERRQIFIDCIHLLSLHEPGNELHLISEVTIPGGSVDYFLVSIRDGKIIDFVGIELQTLDTTGSIWYERSNLIRDKGIEVERNDLVKKTFGVNWKMSAKTILMQMHHKIETFEYLNKHLVLVIQDCFCDYMKREFKFSHLESVRQGDSFHIHSYTFDEANGLRIKLKDRYSTDRNGIATLLGLKAETKVELDKLFEYLQSRVSEKTLLKII